MSKEFQDKSEKIYQDIKAILQTYEPRMHSEFWSDRCQHELIVEIVEACLRNKYFEVRYY